MPQDLKRISKSSVPDLKRISKSSVPVFLATDDRKLIFDDNDNTYLVIRLADMLKGIAKRAGTLTKILKS